MLVEPALTRHDHAARAPLALHRWLLNPVGPHQGVALTAQDHDVDARAMAVGFLVHTNRPRGAVVMHRAVDQRESGAPHPGPTALGIARRLGHYGRAQHIRDVV